MPLSVMQRLKGLQPKALLGGRADSCAQMFVDFKAGRLEGKVRGGKRLRPMMPSYWAFLESSALRFTTMYEKLKSRSAFVFTVMCRWTQHGSQPENPHTCTVTWTYMHGEA